MVMEHRSSSGYSCPLTLQLISSHSSSEVSALFSYDARDPYAVRIRFGPAHAGGKDTVTWLIGRELLRAGLDQPTGDGDVRVGPTEASGDVLFLQLRAPSGEALMELSRTSLAAFIRGTETLVPFGAEGTVTDLDELAVLLSEGGADPFSR
jgi:hypothetical protein